MNTDESDWKLKLRYGKIKTPFHHYTLIGEGVVQNIAEGFECPDGNAYMAMKCRTADMDEAADMFMEIGADIGFTANGKIDIYITAPESPPGEAPMGYDITFSPFK